MIQKKPYFMSNEEWFYFDEQDFCYKLTDKAPEKAKESYRNFYSLLDEVDETE